MKTKKEITLLLEKYSEEKHRPDNSPYLAINLRKALKIAQISGTTLHEVEGVALSAGITPIRYARNQRTLSIAEQKKLHQAHVAVIGLGGLGGGVTELLARIGVGTLTLIDGDCFDESNLNRQLLSTVSNIGKPKTTVASKRVQDINPATRIQQHLQFLRTDNGDELLAGVDLAIDCLDTISDRFILEQVCKNRNIPMVSAAIAGKSGQVTVIFPEDKGLIHLYGRAEDAPKRGVESSLGTLPFTASYMASIECAEAVNLILKNDSPLRNGLLFADLSDYSNEHIKSS